MHSTIRQLRVFLCHASQDKTIVRELQQRLADEGWIDPWLDEKKLHPGEDWRVSIEEAVESSDLVVICLSNSSVDKEGFVQKELRYAREIALEKPEGTIFLIPLRLEECDVPRGLKFFQWADYFGDKKEQNYIELLDSFSIRRQQIVRREQERALREAEEKEKREKEEKARKEAEELAKREAEELARRKALEITLKEEERAHNIALDKARKEAFERALEDAREKARLEAEVYAQKEISEKKYMGGWTNFAPFSLLGVILLLFIGFIFGIGLVGLGQMGMGPFAKVATPTNTNFPQTPTSLPFTPTTVPTILVPPTQTELPPSATPASASIGCIVYNPNNLQIANLGTSGWELTDGSEQVLLLDNEKDANQALELAKRYTKTCYIGNRDGNDRMQYWDGPSGLSSNLIDRDCISYNHNKLELASINNLWTIVESGSVYLEAFPSRLDAEASFQIVKQYNQQCFIGRDNQRNNRIDYIVEYWK